MRVVVAITGATGAAYGVSLLAALRELGVERHLILSRWAEVTILKETGLTTREVGGMATVLHSRDNQGAAIASGSFRHDGMIIAPCSMKTLSAIRCGYADGLIPRAADVHTARIIASRSTRRPAHSTKCRSSAKGFGRSATSSPRRGSVPRLKSSTKHPNT
jgi:polyprenyl P-hydroxybenzoate/phenylacrylic acid decarboxylase-like protein